MLDRTHVRAPVSGSLPMQPTSDLNWATEGALWPNRSASAFASAGGVDWHVQRFGNGGPRLLLLHGTASSTHSWRKLAPLLARDFEIVSVDLPGHAFSRLQRRRTRAGVSSMSLPGMAEQLDALMRALSYTPDIAIGHSAGAAIAVQMCLDETLHPSCVISLNGALLPFGSLGRYIAPTMARALFQNPIAPWIFARQARDASNVERLIRGTGSDLSDEDMAFYVRLFRSREHVKAALEMMANWDLPALETALPKLKTPIVLVAGMEDRAVPPEKATDAQRLLVHSDVIDLPGLGHLAHEEDPDRIAGIIRDVVQKS